MTITTRLLRFRLAMMERRAHRLASRLLALDVRRMTLRAQVQRKEQCDRMDLDQSTMGGFWE